MANAVTGNPFILDTATATIIASGTGGFVDVYAVRWTSGSLADAVQLEDGANVVKWSATGTVANAVDQTVFNPPLTFNGLRCSVLGSGKVYVYAKYRG